MLAKILIKAEDVGFKNRPGNTEQWELARMALVGEATAYKENLEDILSLFEKMDNQFSFSLQMEQEIHQCIAWLRGELKE